MKIAKPDERYTPNVPFDNNLIRAFYERVFRNMMSDIPQYYLEPDGTPVCTYDDAGIQMRTTKPRTIQFMTTLQGKAYRLSIDLGLPVRDPEYDEVPDGK